jgi:hypothetical protein
MAYRCGDYVYPAGLPRPVLCRVRGAESGRTRTGMFQILTLEPLEGPWRDTAPTAVVMRFDADVLPATPRDLWSGA